MGHAKLIIRSHTGESHERELGDETRLGRAVENDVVLEDQSVSRRHALLRRMDGRETLLVDLGSANGTLVNGQPLAAPTRLFSGDEVTIGAFSLTFLEERDVEVEAPAFDQMLTVARKGPRDESLLGSGPAMATVFQMIDRAAASELPVLVEGETGTGKELVARGIHRAGARAAGPFVAVSCAALSERASAGEPLEVSLRRQASGGTLFLDEVCEIGAVVQAKLLRLLDEGTSRTPSEAAAGCAGVRLISSTNRDPAAEMERGVLRPDLYYRLAALRIELPPLRAHREDIPLLSERFLRSASERQKKRIRGFSAEALDVLERADWPGNVRELRNEVDRAVALASDGDEISAALLSQGIREPASSDGAPERVALSAPRAEGVPTPHAPHRPSDVKPTSTHDLFRCDGEFWTLSFAGKTALMKDVKGLRCIARLLREPYREFFALELAAEMEGASSSTGGRPAPRERDEPSTQIAASAGEGLAGLDAQAKSEYRRRLAELREELDDAERDNDPGRSERAQAEIEFLTQQLSAAVGLAGRDRPSGSHAERARLLVTQRVKAALKKLAECHEPLAEHLSTAIKTGYRCSYSPAPEDKVDWQQ